MNQAVNAIPFLQVAQSTHFESRYFILSVPAICALAAVHLFASVPSRLWRAVAVVVIGTAIAGNSISIYRMLRGLGGFEAVVNQLASREDPGNILLSSWFDSDLIFRFRCYPQKQDRQIIRGDRVLAIRNPSYSGVAAEPLAKTSGDVLDIIQLGRIRYLVTCPPSRSTASGLDRRADDMIY